MDFKSLIEELVATGMTQVEIAQECGCSQPAISDLMRGESAQPRYVVGKALVDLHAQRTQARRPTTEAAHG